jgi:hypothetical protein
MTTVTPPTVISDVQEVAAPSPKITGGVLLAPLGTALPTDAVTPLDPGFITLGRVSDAGVDRTEERPNTEINDWGGDLIAVLQDKYGITLKFKLLQFVNADVAKAAHGTDNVTVTPATSTTGTGITSKLNAQLLDFGSWVIDAYYMQMSMRLVVPYGRLTLVGPLTWVHKALAAYDFTLKPFPDTFNNHAYEYLNDGVLAP